MDWHRRTGCGVAERSIEVGRHAVNTSLYARRWPSLAIDGPLTSINRTAAWQGAAVGSEIFRSRALLLPSHGLQRFSIGSTARISGPVYSALGRIMRLSARCSMTCAAQPVSRLMTKIGVNNLVGMPMK